MKCTSIVANFLIVGSISAGGSASGAIWTEVGDAGDHTNPQVTQGIGNLTQIVGSIGDLATNDGTDAFLFAYGGAPGAVDFTATLQPPTTIELAILLYRFQSGNAVFIASSEAGNPSHLTLNDLPPGQYIAELNASSGQGLDPPYTIDLSGPQEPGGFLFAQSPLATPEPMSLTIWTALSAALVLVRRRRERI